MSLIPSDNNLSINERINYFRFFQSATVSVYARIGVNVEKINKIREKNDAEYMPLIEREVVLLKKNAKLLNTIRLLQDAALNALNGNITRSALTDHGYKLNFR